jgi:hypothetical protein
MKRIHECKYDDNCKKSRTQLLREKMAVLEAKLRDLESESYSPHVVSLALSDSSATSESSFETEPIFNLSAEMHNILYVVPKNILVYSLSDCSKAFKLLSDIIGNAVSTQTLVDSTHHRLQSSIAAHPTLPS